MEDIKHFDHPQRLILKRRSGGISMLVDERMRQILEALPKDFIEMHLGRETRADQKLLGAGPTPITHDPDYVPPTAAGFGMLQMIPMPHQGKSMFMMPLGGSLEMPLEFLKARWEKQFFQPNWNDVQFVDRGPITATDLSKMLKDACPTPEPKEKPNWRGNRLGFLDGIYKRKY